MLVERARADAAQAEAAVARAEQSDAQALIAHLKLPIETLRREIYGQRCERSVRLLDPMELQLEEREATTSEDELKTEQAAAKATPLAGFNRRRSTRKPFPAHLPRERVIVPGPTSCAGCGGTRLSKLGEAGQGSGGGAAGMPDEGRLSPRRSRSFRGSGR